MRTKTLAAISIAVGSALVLSQSQRATPSWTRNHCRLALRPQTQFPAEWRVPPIRTLKAGLIACSRWATRGMLATPILGRFRARGLRR